VYPDGEIKYKCLSRGYTAWWQRKTYFTFLAAYILVVPALVIRVISDANKATRVKAKVKAMYAKTKSTTACFHSIANGGQPMSSEHLKVTVINSFTISAKANTRT